MKNYEKGIGTIGVCVLVAFAISTDHPILAGFIFLFGMAFTWAT